MNKITLNSFIQKYNLGGNINSVIWKSDGKKLTTDFISGDKSLLGILELNKQAVPKFGDEGVGIYDTKALSNIISPLSDNLDFQMNVESGEAKSFDFKDDHKMKSKFVLAKPGVIPDVPELKKIPEFDTLINLDSQFINSFIKSKGALTEAEHFTVRPVENGVEFVIGHLDHHSNRITMMVKSGAVALEGSVTFNADLFKEVLSANQECSKAELQIASNGLAHVEFKIDDFVAKYYLVAQQGN